ncbi:MEGF10_11 [Mytilus coruscus]|uniref:MEGF10_11 n=1 Tax=Mytilus coruscus TaxID=42192 RepID=A0A6J8ESP4_MYTCO|nr:MEGF10_11 [Mytilus coruscus]
MWKKYNDVIVRTFGYTYRFEKADGDQCSIGYKATEENTCVPCDGNAYGKECLQRCQCSNVEICDHIQGCINIFKSTDAGKSSQYSKGTEWPDNKSADFVDTTFQLSKSSHSFSTGRPDVKQKVNVEKKGSSSISSHLIIYVVCTGSLAVIIALSILFRRFCYRQTITFCWKTKNSVRIANHRNDNYNDEFLNEIFELERYGSIYDIIDEQNMIENIEQLQDDMNSGDTDVPHYDLD